MNPGSGDPSPSGIPEPWTPVVVERAGGGLARFPGNGPDEDRRLRLDRALTDGVRALDGDRAALWDLSTPEAPRILAFVDHPGSGGLDFSPPPAPVGTQVAGLLERLGLLALEDALREPRPGGALGEWLQARSTRAMLAMPVGVGKGTVAAAVVVEVAGLPRTWSTGDRETLRALAASLLSLLPTGEFGPARDPEHPPSESSPPDRSQSGRAQPHRPQPDQVHLRRSHPEGRRSDGPEPALRDPTPPEDEGKRVRPRVGLESTVRRLVPMEGAGILGLELARELRGLGEAQDGFLALLEEVLDSGRAESALVKDAREAGRRALERLRGFLDWTERGTAAHRPLELNALVAELSVRLGKITGDSVPLLFSPSSGPVQVRGVAGEIVRALEHLVRNAREASRVGDRVRISVRRGDGPPGAAERDWARIEVEDSGPGIDSGLLPWVFDPFVSGRGQGGDRGLGLAVVRAVVEGHGGRVELRTRPGRGTVALVELPGVEAARTLEDPGEVGPEGGSLGDGHRPLVVLVEDDPILSRLLDRTLDRGGFGVQRVEHVNAAHRLLAQTDLPIRLVVVERRGPAGESGAEFVRRVREDRPDCPAVLLDRRLRTEDSEVRAAIRREEELPDDVPVLSPPFDPSDVLALARRLVPSAAEGDGAVH